MAKKYPAVFLDRDGTVVHPGHYPSRPEDLHLYETWHIHGSYLNTLARIDADWYLPVKEGRPEEYGGRGPIFDLLEYVREVPAEQVRDLQLDLILYQSPKNYFEDQGKLRNVLPCNAT